MTSIFTKVKPGDLITSDLFNQITDKIEEMHEITAVMEVKKNSEADASELGNLSVKGNVGIGTKDSPSEKLEVNGTVKTGNDGQLLLLKGIKSSKKGEESSMNLDFMTSSQDRTPPSIPTASVRAIDDEKSAHLGFFTNEASEDQYKLTERLRITSNGKVGIGTTDPSEKLEVSGIVKADKFKGDGSGLTGIKTGQWTDVAGGISYNSGNIGIGSDSPENADGWSRVLDILGSNTTKLSIRTQNIDARVLSHENGFWGAPAGMIIGTKSAHYLSFGTSATSRMTINKDGNVGIGTPTPSAKLEVNGDIKARAIEAKPALHDFKVEGDLDKFYPVLFRDDNWVEGPLILEINRPDVNTDSEDRGSLISKFTVHSPKLGNGADMCRAEIYDSVTQFIAGYQNDNFSDKFVVWLRGGGTTYYFRSNHFATLEDFSATEKKYKVNEKEITFIIKTSVDSNVLSNTIHFDKSLIIDGNVGIGTMPQKEKLEVKGTVKADKFLGDGSGLTGIKTGQWTDVVGGGISYTGNVGIGISTPGAKLEVNLVNPQGWSGPLNALRIKSPDDRFFMDLTTFDNKDGNVGYLFRTRDWHETTKDTLTLYTNGNVGIGTTAPSEKLEVSGTVKAAKFVGDGSGLTGIASTNKTQWTDVTGGISYNSGNVGIGTDKPENAEGWTKVLDILGSVSSKLSVRTQNVDARVLSHESSFWGAPAGMIVGTKSAHSLSFVTSATSRMTINKDGKVGIGTTNPIANLDVGGYLHVSGNANPDVSVQGAYLGWNALTGGTGETDFINNKGLGSGGFAFMNTPQSGTPRNTLMFITGSGNVGIGTTNPTTTLEVNGNIKVSKINQDDWTDVKPGEFLNGWINHSDGYNDLGYFLDKSGIVHLKGLIKGGIIGFSSAIFKLPSNCCPAHRELHIVISGDILGRCDITPDGNVFACGGNKNWFSLDGITFRAK